MRYPPNRLRGPILASLLLAACTPAGAPAALQPAGGATLVTQPGEGPPDARPGACYGKDVTPAVVEVVTEQVLVTPPQIAADGAVIRPAVYQTDSRQAIVQERRAFFFETPCATVLTPEFIASVQRALKARGVYRGPVTGEMDARTRRAIRRFQLPSGLNSEILTMETARQLGLIAYDRDAQPPATQ